MNLFKQSKSILFILLFGVIFTIKISAQTSLWDGTHEIWTNGSGSSSDPYLIEDAKHLAYLAYAVNNGIDANSNNEVFRNKYFKLMIDIDLNGTQGFQWPIIGTTEYFFSGNFNGNNFIIRDILFYSDEDYAYAGLFGSITNATLNNIHLESGSIRATSDYVTHVAGIVGYAEASRITNCINGANINSDGEYYSYAAGIVAYCQKNMTITNCHNYGSISSLRFSAGILCYYALTSSPNLQINECSNHGKITAYSYAGGIVGESRNKFKIINSYNKGDIESNVLAAGIIARTDIADYTSASSIQACYNAGNIHVTKDNVLNTCAASGIISYLKVTSGVLEITNNYNIGYISSVGDVTKGAITGRIGGGNSLTYTYNYNYFSNTCNAGTINQDQSESLTEDEMKEKSFVLMLNASIPESWKCDFALINDGYPVLLWQEGTASPCDTPTNLAVNDIEETQATLSWEGEADEYFIYYGKTESDLYPVNTTLNTYTIKNLEMDTDYIWKIKAVCSPCDIESEYVYGSSFKTKFTGIEDFSKNISLYPNPVNSILNINTNSIDFHSMNIKIFNIHGKIISDFNKTDKNFDIDVSSLPKGIYIIQVNIDGYKVLVDKIVRE